MTDAPKDIPYIVYESSEARHERNLKRLVTIILILIALLFASNMAWLFVWNLYDYSDSSVVVDSKSEGNASYIGANGVINNGEGSSEDENEETQ